MPKASLGCVRGYRSLWHLSGRAVNHHWCVSHSFLWELRECLFSLQTEVVGAVVWKHADKWPVAISCGSGCAAAHMKCFSSQSLGLFSYLLALRGRCAPGGLVLTEMPNGQQEDRWRLTANVGVAALLLCHAIFLWCWLVCLSQFKTSGKVMLLNDLLIHPSGGRWPLGCDWTGYLIELARHFYNTFYKTRENLICMNLLFLLWKCQDEFYQDIIFTCLLM